MKINVYIPHGTRRISQDRDDKITTTINNTPPRNVGHHTLTHTHKSHKHSYTLTQNARSVFGYAPAVCVCVCVWLVCCIESENENGFYTRDARRAVAVSYVGLIRACARRPRARLTWYARKHYRSIRYTTGCGVGFCPRHTYTTC